MLTPYCQKVLQLELVKTDYDDKTADEAWSWLMDLVTPSGVTRPSGVRLTPLLVAGLLGPAKAEAIAVALKTAFPTIGELLMQAGVDPLAPASQTFFASLVAGNVITAEDVGVLAATAVVTTQSPSYVRFDRRFFPGDWPHVTADGDIGTESDQAIHGFPNTIDRSDFDAAWAVARGS